MEREHAMKGEVLVVRPNGPRLDALSAPIFKIWMAEALDRRPTKLVIDLAEVEFMDSAGLGSMIASAKLLGPGGRLAVACLSDAVEDLLDFTRMNQVFQIEPDVDAAVAFFER
jgi:anti-sigma B factor antagonist